MQRVPKAKNKQTGSIGETTAFKLLKQKEYKIIDINYRTKFAELDMVAIDRDTLVFVEVKTRRNTKYGLPEEAVGARKVHKITQAGNLYVQTHFGLPKKHRIDVVSIILEGSDVKSAKIIKVT